MEHGQWQKRLAPALQSKFEDFQLLGIQLQSVDQLWVSIVEKKWRGQVDGRPLYELVNDIMAFKPHEFLSYETRKQQAEERGVDQAERLRKLVAEIET